MNFARRSLWALFVAGLLFPTSAAAQWTLPVDISEGGQDASSPQVAVDRSGDAVFTWRQFDGAHFRVQARARAADGTLSPVQTLSAARQDAASPQVNVDADGDAVFAWVRSDGTAARVQARARAADGTLGPLQTLSAPGQDAGAPQMGVDADGDAVFAWTRFDGAHFRVQTRARAADGTLSAARTLSGSGQHAGAPDVDVETNGDAVFTWARFDGANYRVQARALAADGALSAVRTVSPAGSWAEAPQVGVDEAGDSVFTWQYFDGPFLQVQARARAADGTLGPVQAVSTGAESASNPQVAVDADGGAVFTWRRLVGVNELVDTRTRTSAGTLRPVHPVSDLGPNELNPQVAANAAGEAVFTWSRSDGMNSLVETRPGSVAGPLLPFTVLSDPGEDANGAEVAVGEKGDAIVTWARFDGANARIQASAGP